MILVEIAINHGFVIKKIGNLSVMFLDRYERMLVLITTALLGLALPRI